MKIMTNGRGYRFVIAEKYQNEPGEYTRLIGESSAIGSYDDSFECPGSSFLWIGNDHHLSRDEVSELIKNMQYWIDHKRLPENEADLEESK